MATTPTRVRQSTRDAAALAGIGHEASASVDGGTMACEGMLSVFKRFRYKSRYATVASGLFKIYGSQGSSAPPKLTVSVATMTWTEDMTAALSADRRFTVDTGADVIVLRAPSVSEKNTWIRAFEREQALLSPRASANVGLARTQSIGWRLEIGDYLLAGNPIGAGGFGNVMQGMHRSNHRRIAAKVLRLDSRSVSTQAVEDEISTMGTLRHKNIVELLEVIYVDENIVYAPLPCSRPTSPAPGVRTCRWPR